MNKQPCLFNCKPGSQSSCINLTVLANALCFTKASQAKQAAVLWESFPLRHGERRSNYADGQAGSAPGTLPRRKCLVITTRSHPQHQHDNLFQNRAGNDAPVSLSWDAASGASRQHYSCFMAFRACQKHWDKLTWPYSVISFIVAEIFLCGYIKRTRTSYFNCRVWGHWPLRHYC